MVGNSSQAKIGHLDEVEMKWTPRPGLRAPRLAPSYPSSSFRVLGRECFIIGGVKFLATRGGLMP